MSTSKNQIGISASFCEVTVCVIIEYIIGPSTEIFGSRFVYYWLQFPRISFWEKLNYIIISKH